MMLTKQDKKQMRTKIKNMIKNLKILCRKKGNVEQKKAAFFRTLGFIEALHWRMKK